MTQDDAPRTRAPESSAPAGPVRRWAVTALEPRAASVAWVRHQARTALAGWGAQDYEWVVVQLLSEVATNAVLHAGSPFDVALTFTEGRVRCEVTDSDPRPPRTRHYSAQSTTGRGIRMVDQLSEAWGVTRRETGKTVWFEVVADSMDGKDPLSLFEEVEAFDTDPTRRAEQSAGATAVVDLRVRAEQPASRWVCRAGAA